MKRFKNILVVASPGRSDEEDQALIQGLELAKKNDGRLTLMDVIQSPHETISEYKGIIKAEELTAMMIEEKEKALKNIIENIGGNHPHVDIKVSIGTGFIEIVRQMIFGKHDLLIKMANKHPTSFDSSDFHLMRKCPEPVWLFKENHETTPKRILAAIDLSSEKTEEGRALNTLIMDLATSLSSWENSELHTLSCWSLYGENALRHSGFIKIPEEKLNSLIQEEESFNQDLQAALLNRYADFSVQNHLIKGDPIEHVPTFVREHNIDIVIMGTVARSGIPGLLIGNTAETILTLIDASVITVKPGGFESPIR